MASIEVTECIDEDVRRRTLKFWTNERFVVGTMTLAPDALVVTWSRVNKEPWRMVAIELHGAKVVHGLIRSNSRRTYKFGAVTDAPRWALSLAKSNLPAGF